MARSLDLAHLTRQPDNARGPDWEQAFFHALVDGRVYLEQKEPRTGPDGWPYMFANTETKATEPAVRLLEWLSTRGIGLVINGQKDVPDYVFPYGMIWYWKEKGEFITPRDSILSGKVEFTSGEKVLAGPPTPEFLPDYVRKIIGQFLKSQGVSEPKILMISKDKKHYDLCVSLESLGSPPEHEHKGIAQAIAWFLPQHYSILLISESGMPKFGVL